MKTADYRIESTSTISFRLMPGSTSVNHLYQDRATAIAMAAKAVTDPPGKETHRRIAAPLLAASPNTLTGILSSRRDRRALTMLRQLHVVGKRSIRRGCFPMTEWLREVVVAVSTTDGGKSSSRARRERRADENRFGCEPDWSV